MTIRQATVDEIIFIASQIPEFSNPYDKQEYDDRLKNKISLSLVCEIDNQLVGFKLGYQLSKQEFYSWFGGVLPKFRGMGVAKALADAQEIWVKNEGFTRIRLKTRNYLKPMLIFALSSGFYIHQIEKRPNIADHRIILIKDLHAK